MGFCRGSNGLALRETLDKCRLLGWRLGSSLIFGCVGWLSVVFSVVLGVPDRFWAG